MDFQRANGLAVDGVVDIDTWRVMLALADRLPPAMRSPPPASAQAPPSTAAPHEHRRPDPHVGTR